MLHITIYKTGKKKRGGNAFGGTCQFCKSKRVLELAARQRSSGMEQTVHRKKNQYRNWHTGENVYVQKQTVRAEQTALLGHVKTIYRESSDQTNSKLKKSRKGHHKDTKLGSLVLLLHSNKPQKNSLWQLINMCTSTYNLQ